MGNVGQVVEIDETFIGGHIPNDQGAKGKVKVLGLAERGGRIRFQIVPNIRIEGIGPALEKSLSPNARQIVTDSVSLLGSCGLHGAQTELKRATGRH
jgi:hypothetical protein